MYNSEQTIDGVRKAGKLLSGLHKVIEKYLTPGVSTMKLDNIAFDYMRNNNCIPICMGYNGYPCVTCISINEEIVHGIPYEDKIIREDDVVTIDIALKYNGYCADSARSYVVGDQPGYITLVNDTEWCLRGLIKDLPIQDLRLKDIGAYIANYARFHNYGNVYKYYGHGIGKEMHEYPVVPNHDNNDPTFVEEGMILCIEPIFVLGIPNTYVKADEWTVCTSDHSIGAHYEDTVLVNKKGFEILT